MKRLLLAALLLAGCGSTHAEVRKGVSVPPPLGARCGGTHARSRTLWFRASDGTRLDGAELGHGPRGVILLHQSGDDLCGWEPYAEKLAPRGFHVLLVDLRGHGLSKPGAHPGARGAVADVRGAVAELKRLGAERVAVVGASYGAVNALVAAPKLGSEIVGVASLGGELVLGSGSDELNALAAVRDLRVPLLVLASRGDRFLNEPDARRMVRAAGSQQKSLVELGGYAHGWDLLAFPPQNRPADRALTDFLMRVTQ